MRERLAFRGAFVESIIHERPAPPPAPPEGALAALRDGRRPAAPRAHCRLATTRTHLAPLPAPSHLDIAWPDPSRRAAFANWLAAIAPDHRLLPESLRPASSDASFRRYFRLDTDPHGTCIVMDAPPPEDVARFVHVAGLLADADLPAPRVLAADMAGGFLLLTDMGPAPLLATLQRVQAAGDTAIADRWMRRACSLLADWQRGVPQAALPPFDTALLRRDLDLFPAWCVERELNARWTDDDRAAWQDACTALIDDALAQPTVAVHRDYMPRNLIVGDAHDGSADRLGIIDFQDAVRGPIGYDLASLLRDAYIGWEEEQELDWAVRYWQSARKSLPLPDDFGEFWRQVEWCGLQRHLKILGIFCRLKHRDGKPAYSAELPRFFAHAHKVAARYNRLRPLSRLLEPLMGAERLQVYS